MDRIANNVDGLKRNSEFLTHQQGELQTQIRDLSRTFENFMNETNAKERELRATHENLRKVHENLLEEKRQDLRNYEEDYAWHQDTLRRLEDLIQSIRLINEKLQFHDKEIRDLHKMAYIQGKKYELFTSGKRVPYEQDLGTSYTQRGLGSRAQLGSLPSLPNVLELDEPPEGIPSNGAIQRLFSPDGPNFTFGQTARYNSRMQPILNRYSTPP